MKGGNPPRCACGGIVKPDVVLYGEPLDPDTWQAAEEAVAEADLMLVAGTSLRVYPAAGLLQRLRRGRLVLINREPTAMGPPLRRRHPRRITGRLCLPSPGSGRGGSWGRKK